jgi:hypothetical protein
MATETLTFATSQNHVTDTDQIRSILGVKTLLEPLDYTDFFYHVEVVMRRSPMLVSPDFPVEGVLTFSGVHTLSGPEAAVMAEPEFGETETPSVPIPPPTKAETAAITALREFALGFPPTFGVLTPSPECLLVELATTAPGFG